MTADPAVPPLAPALAPPPPEAKPVSPRMRQASLLFASLLGLGHVPFAPGTLASAVAVLLALPLIHLGSVALPEATLAVTILGLLAVERTGHADQDPSWIVIDEVAGQWLAMASLIRPSPAGLLLAFALFRLLDITKFGPVGWADKRRNAGAIMADDLIAGAIVAVVIWVVELTWPHLLR